MAINRIACELVRSGGLGKVLEVRAVNYPGSEDPPAKPFPAEPVPAGLDWDIWLNQGAARPYNGQWMNWEHWRDFAGGEITNWGAHGVDQIQWALGMDATGPVEMWPLTGHKTGRNALCQRRAGPLRARPKAGHGRRIFVCEKGKLEINRNKFAPTPRTSPPSCSRKSTCG